MPLPPFKSHALAGKRSLLIAVVMAGLVVLILAAGVAIWSLKIGRLKRAHESPSVTAAPAAPAGAFAGG